MWGLDIKEIITATMILFAVVDIIGSIPVIIDLRQKVGHIQSGKATIVSIILMIIFLFVGEQMLSLIGIDVNSFAVAGSLIIFFIALEMILGIQLHKSESLQSAAIVPLAFPLIAGAGTLTSILSLKSEYHSVNIVVAILINCLVVYIVLKSSEKIEKVLGNQGIEVVRKIFGVILLAIAVKLFTTNIQGLLNVEV